MIPILIFVTPIIILLIILCLALLSIDYPCMLRHKYGNWEDGIRDIYYPLLQLSLKEDVIIKRCKICKFKKVRKI